MKRTSGILLPIFSLPGKYGIGCFSREAYKFVDFLEAAGQSYWQILPLGPTSYGDSPYQAFSTFAGNPYFIDLTELKNQKLLTSEEIEEADFGNKENDIDYGTIYKNRFKVLRKAFHRAVLSEFGPYQDFLKENEDWLPDYAFYMAVKNSFHDVGLMEWKEDIRLRKKEAMERCRKDLAEDIDFYCFLQYEFYRQWGMLKSYAFRSMYPWTAQRSGPIPSSSNWIRTDGPLPWPGARRMDFPLMVSFGGILFMTGSIIKRQALSGGFAA